MKYLKRQFTATGCIFFITLQAAATGHFSSAPTAAAATPTSIADTSRIFNLDEIIVVSQPKESSLLRNQPMASSIFTHEETEKLGIRDISSLAAFVPSFQMPAYGSRLTSSMYIRGIGSRINNPAVGIYMDGMPLLNKSSYNIHIYQTDRADVLRGPQGTLYGMNTEGGLLRLYSKNPMAYSGTDIRLGMGNRMYRNAEAATYQRLGANTAISVASFYEGQNGFFRNTTTGSHADLYNEAGAKISIVNSTSNRWNLDFTSDYQYANQRAFPYGEYDTETGKTASPAMNRDNSYRRNMLNSALNIRYTRPGTTITSTTSWQFLSDDMYMDQDYTALDFMHLKQKQLSNGLTQELALKRSRKTWKYSTGLFASYQWLRTEAPVFFDKDFTSAMAAGIEAAAHGIIKVKGIDMSVPGLFHTPQYNIGVFHESTVTIVPKLNMTIGLRYDYSHTQIKYATSATMDMAVSAMGHEMQSRLRSALDGGKSNAYNQILPKLGFTWTIANDGSNIYALVNKGYRSGGYNMQMFSDILQTELQANRKAAMGGNYDVAHTQADYDRINATISYKPEFCWNYELGSHLNLFRNRIQADFSVYYMKIRNQQLSVMAGTYGFGRMMVNAGRSHSCGIEATLRGTGLDNRLSWHATYGFTRSVFDNYHEESNGSATDYAGKLIPFIPRHSLSAAADMTLPVRGLALKSIEFGASVTAQGDTYWDEANTFSQDFYATAGAHAGVNFSRMSISVHGRNITSTRYNTFAFSSNATGKEMRFAQRGMPLQVSIDVNYHFGR